MSKQKKREIQDLWDNGKNKGRIGKKKKE